MKITFAVQVNTIGWLQKCSQVGEFHLHGVYISVLWPLARTDLAVLKNMSHLVMTQVEAVSVCCVYQTIFKNVFSSLCEVAISVQF